MNTQARRYGDEGSAFMTVVAVTAILFVLSTMVMMMVGYQTQAMSVRANRLRATHVADAGVNAYLFNLKNDPTYSTDVPDTGWVAVGDGEQYRVVVSAATATAPLTLHSSGVSRDGQVTVAATVRFPSFADYMFLTNANLDIAGDARIEGSVRSNGSINNQGQITGKAIAAGTVTGNGSAGQGNAESQPVVDFNEVLVVMDTIRTAAISAGRYYSATGSYGYKVTVSGTTAYIERVLGGTDTGDFWTTPVGMVTIPSSGVLYFADDVWVSGNYGVPLSIVSDGDLYVIDNYIPTSPGSRVTSALMAQRNVIVPAWYRTVKDDMLIQAALLSATGRVYADVKQGVIRNRITIQGAVTAFDSGGTWGSYDFNGQPIAGFRQNGWTYDQRLMDEPPPFYPQVFDGTLKVDTWVEEGAPAFPS